MRVTKVTSEDPVFKPITLELTITSWEELEALRAAAQRLINSDLGVLIDWIDAENREVGEFGCAGEQAASTLVGLLTTLYGAAADEYQD